MRPKFCDIPPKDWARASRFGWCEPKWDGWYCTVRCVGRRWEIRSRTDRVLERGRLCHAIDDTIVAGELLRGTEWAKQLDPDLYDDIAAFAAYRIDGTDIAEPHGNSTRERMTRLFRQHSTEDIVKRMFLVERCSTEFADWLWRKRVDDQNFEGLVFTDGIRLARMKAQITHDYVCLGFESSHSARYHGRGVRSVVAGLYRRGELVRACNVGGLTDEQRQEFFRNPDRYVGRVFEATGKRLFASGALRHPSFVRWRDDKPPKDCV